MNNWNLQMVYTVDAEKDRSASKNFISITTILSNDSVLANHRREIKYGEIFQTYFSMKDANK